MGLYLRGLAVLLALVVGGHLPKEWPAKQSDLALPVVCRAIYLGTHYVGRLRTSWDLVQ
jgi:hypothetical protein